MSRKKKRGASYRPSDRSRSPQRRSSPRRRDPSYHARSRSPSRHDRQYRDHDSYHPGYGRGDGHRRPRYSTPPRAYSPSPGREGPSTYRPRYSPSPSPDMYQFRGRTQNNSSFPPGQGPPLIDRVERRDDFSFRAVVKGPRFPPSGPAFGANDGRSRPQPQKRNGPASRGGRGGFGYKGASDRFMLRSKRPPTPDRLEGMQKGSTSFKGLDDLSDSEEEMDLESDSDSDSQCDREPAAKRTRVATDSAPRWSNPDPYTSLPPLDESTGKKKDVVKMIRRAKVTADEKSQPNDNLVADNADFIAFEADEVQEYGESVSQSSIAPPRHTGEILDNQPSTFSHLDNLHPDRYQPSHSLPPRPNLAAVPGRHQFKLPPKAPAPGADRGQNGRRVELDDNEPSMQDSNTQGQSRPQKRKRGPDDQLPLQPRKLKTRRAEITGDILPEWKVFENGNGTPWCTSDYSSSEPMGLWLHREIEDFYQHVKPRDFERAMRQDLITRVDAALRHRYDGTVHCFGSFAAGIFLPSSDMDLVFLSNTFLSGGPVQYGKSATWMFKLRDELVDRGVAHERGTEVIAKAKVPIIKFVDKKTNLRVDISFENTTGLTANGTFQQWKSQFPAMPIIVTLVKQFLLMRGLNEVFVGGIGGFTVTCLVTSLLQHFPVSRGGDKRPEDDLGYVLLRFLDFYGNSFDLNAQGISMKPARLYGKKISNPNRVDRLEILDPNNTRNDISGGSKLAKLIFQEFSRAHAKLQSRIAELDRMTIDERKDQSILRLILAGDYKSFGYQRNHLRNIFDKK